MGLAHTLVHLVLEVVHLLSCMVLQGGAAQTSYSSSNPYHNLLCCVLCAFGLATDIMLAGLAYMLALQLVVLARTLVPPSWHTLQAEALHMVLVHIPAVAPGHTLLPVLVAPPPSGLPTMM